LPGTTCQVSSDLVIYLSSKQSHRLSENVRDSRSAPLGWAEDVVASISKWRLTLPHETRSSYAEPLRIRTRHGFEDRTDDPSPRRSGQGPMPATCPPAS
jgi:hypothetical protein